MSHSRTRSRAARLAISRRTERGESFVMGAARAKRPALRDIHEVPDDETTEEMPENFSSDGRRGTLRLPPLVGVVRK